MWQGSQTNCLHNLYLAVFICPEGGNSCQFLLPTPALPGTPTMIGPVTIPVWLLSIYTGGCLPGWGLWLAGTLFVF